MCSKPLYRKIEEQDIEPICKNFLAPWATPQSMQEKWRKYFQEQKEGRRTVLLVVFDGKIVGYGSLIESEYLFFRSNRIPEINDVWIDASFRNKGLGTSLIKHLEHLAKTSGYHQVGLGVGLYKDYGPAQKLYFDLGYCPDGNGITYLNAEVKPGNTYRIDDDLILWLIKDVS